MAYKPGRQCVQVEVAHPVTAYNHGRTLLVERINNGLQRIGRRIQVVAVKLYGKASAPLVVHGNVPTAANTKVGAPRNDVYQPLIRISVEQLCSVVGRMIVHHNDVILERSLLRQCAVNGVTYCLFAVAHGNDDRSLHVEVLLVKVGLGVICSVNQRPHGLKMGSNGTLHLYLHLAVGRVYIVKLLHAACPCVAFLFRIKIFIYMEHAPVAAQIEPQLVPPGIFVVGLFRLVGERA